MFNKAGKFSGLFTKIYKPTITSPTASQILSSRTPTVTSSTFSKYGNITHASSDWQVSDASDFNTIRWSSSNDSTNKTSITTADLGGGDRYVRVRYKANNGIYSDWSDAVLFTSPWASGSNATLSTPTNMDVNDTTTITLETGTYRVTLWGGGGGTAEGGGNGPRSGGGAGSVVKDVTYATPTSFPVTVGTKGGYGAHNGPGGPAGSPGGGSGGYGGGGGDFWPGGGGGGSSTALSMTAAGGGGSGGDGGGPGGPGGSGDSAGGPAGGGSGATSGSPGNGSGGGGGGGNQGGAPRGTAGNGGSNSGTYSSAYNSPGTIAANRYYSSSYSRYFGDTDQNGGARIQKIAAQVTPVVSFTTNLATTYSSTAGSSNNFSVAATDTANTNSTVSYQWYLSTDGGSSYSTISGETSSTLGRYNPFYYSDNTHKFKCRATVTNSVGTSYTDSNVCTLTVARNYDCNGSTITGSVTISNSGLKPSTNGSGDQEWGNWSPGFSDICQIDGYTNSFDAYGRFCDWNMQLQLQITRSTNGSKLHWGDSSNSNTSGQSRSFQLNANGGGWTPETDGTPTYRLMIIDSGTQCQSGSQDIGAQQSQTATLYYSYKRRQYYYESRP